MRVDTDGNRHTCHCSYCNETLVYEGKAAHAHGVVAAQGWQVSRATTEARCTLCVADFGHALYETLRRLVTQ